MISNHFPFDLPATGASVDIPGIVRATAEGLLLEIGLYYSAGASYDITGAVWDPAGDNQAMTLLQTGGNLAGTFHTKFFGLAAPTSAKTGIIRVTFAGSGNTGVIGMVNTVTGHDPAVWVTASNVVNDDTFTFSAPITGSLASSAADKVVDMLLYKRPSASLLSAGTGQAEFYKNTPGSYVFTAATSVKPGAAGTVATSYNADGTETAPGYAILFQASIRMLAGSAAVLSSPVGTATGTTTATATVSSDTASGTLYYLASTNATETATTIKASGASQAVTATGTQNVSFTGLTASTLYYSHFVQVANSADSNVANGSGFTTASVSAPVLSAPSATTTGTTTATANVSTTVGSGTLYAYASVNPTETSATIKASGTQKTVIATGAQSVNLTGLTPGSVYYLHFVHNAASTDSGVSNSASFTMPLPTVTFAASGTLKNLNGSVLPDGSYSIVIRSKTNLTAAPLAVKTGLAVASGIAPGFSITGPVAATEYIYEPVNESDPTIRGLARATPA